MEYRSAFNMLIALILKRPVQIDPDVPATVLFQRGISTLLGLARGFILTRRKIVLGRGTHIRGGGRLHTCGGLVRIEDHCLLDCTSIKGIHLGRNFRLGAYSRIITSGTLSSLGQGVCIGDNVGIGEFAYIGGAGGVTIGKDTIVGQYFSVHPENHVFTDLERPIREQGVTRKGIRVGQGCWIGAKVTLTDGVAIGRNCVIAAGSVVTRSFPDNSVIGGVPARLLYSRNDNKDNCRA